MQVVVRQISGLGNQLFQYAAGTYFAQRFQAPLRLATELPQNQVSHGRFARPVLLSQFSIPVPMHPLTALERTLFSDKKPIRMLQPAIKAALGIQLFVEPESRRFQFIRDISLQPGTRTLLLFGYWQSWQTVEAVAPILRRDLQLRAPATGRNLELLQQIARTPNPVSLHVRRGDYTLAAEGNRTLPLDFYARAVAHMQQYLANPTFFVFSDDIPFTRANLPAHLPLVFVDHNDDASSHEDMRLMSACHHHIIANSSFSWWGAWLNPRPQKIVIAPKYWMLTPDSFFPDLLPPEWIASETSLRL